MKIEQMQESLNQAYKFRVSYSLANLAYQGLCRPNLALIMILSRIKFRYNGPSIVLKKLFYGDKMFLKLPDGVGELLYFYSYFDYDSTHNILSFLKPGMVFADVGAHFGYFSLLASKIVSDKGFVHSFEPTKTTFDILNMNTSNKNNIKVNNIAAWSSDTNLEFYEYGEVYAAYNSFTKSKIRNFHGKVNKTKVRAMKLDSYFNEKMPDFVKIDAESAELEILKGMENILQNKGPIIMLEVGDLVDDIPSSRNVVEHLLDRNYKAYERKNEIIIPHNLKDSYSYGNLLFIKN